MTWIRRRVLRNFDLRACSRVKIVVAESFLQTQERRLSGAVTGSDFFEFPFVLQVIDEEADVGHGCSDEVHAAENDVCVRVYGAGGFEDLLDAGVRAAIDQHQSVGSFDGESELGELEGARNIGNGVQQKNAWSDLREFIDEDEVADVVEFAGAKMFGIGGVEITHFGGWGRLGPGEHLRKLRTAKAVVAIGGDVNGDVRFDLE